ncbi:MAG TPA: hypothetical protein PLU94_01280 [Methanoregulaceae archaeon]|nr:hypothetical protein [Methanoregulaceae archaeon]
MHAQESHHSSIGEIRVTDEVIAFIMKRKCDFRISTSCGGPILLPVSIKSPKPTDIQIPAGDYIIYVSVHQARYLTTVHMGLIPYFMDEIEEESNCPYEL